MGFTPEPVRRIRHTHERRVDVVAVGVKNKMESRKTQRDLILGIYIEDSYRCPARSSLANQIDSAPLKMLVPILSARMKQLCNLVCLRIDTRQVRSLVQIAIDTGKSKVVEIVGPAMNLRNDVFDVKCGERRIILMQVTILASILGALTDLSSSPRPDHLRMMWWRDAYEGVSCMKNRWFELLLLLYWSAYDGYPFYLPRATRGIAHGCLDNSRSTLVQYL